MRSTTYNDDGSVIESVVLCAEDDIYGVDIPKNVWHNLESLEPGSDIFECKEGPFVPHEEEGILSLDNILLQPSNHPPANVAGRDRRSGKLIKGKFTVKAVL